MPGAKSIKLINAPRRDAYIEINRIQAEIEAAMVGRNVKTVPILMCLGATATILAHRLAARGLWAIDLGHVGMFMKSAGAYAISPHKLASKHYRKQLQEMHKEIKWGRDGWLSAGEVFLFKQELGAESILDYCSGRVTLAQAKSTIRVYEYDPGIKGKDALPKPCHLIVCTDVLEHVEPDAIDSVLSHVHKLATKGIYLVVST